MNHITLLGRLTKDADIRTTPSGKTVATFTLAVDRPFSGADGKKETDFIPCVVWGKSAELIGNSCQKGHRLLVEGRLQIRNFEAKDGTKRYVAEVIANSFEFIERKAEGNAGRPPHAMAGMGKEVPFDDEVDFG